jgi:hypothetical protein
MYETVMVEPVMFIIIMLARVDCFKNTQLERLGWEPHGIVHITTKLTWKPWRRALYTHQQRVEKYTVAGLAMINTHSESHSLVDWDGE